MLLTYLVLLPITRWAYATIGEYKKPLGDILIGATGNLNLTRFDCLGMTLNLLTQGRIRLPMGYLHTQWLPRVMRENSTSGTGCTMCLILLYDIPLPNEPPMYAQELKGQEACKGASLARLPYLPQDPTQIEVLTPLTNY